MFSGSTSHLLSRPQVLAHPEETSALYSKTDYFPGRVVENSNDRHYLIECALRSRSIFTFHRQALQRLARFGFFLFLLFRVLFPVPFEHSSCSRTRFYDKSTLRCLRSRVIVRDFPSDEVRRRWSFLPGGVHGVDDYALD